MTYYTGGCLGKESKIIVFGSGGHARSVVNVIREIDSQISVVLIDDNAYEDEIILGCKVEREYSLEEYDAYILAIGDNRKRKSLYDKIINNQEGVCISLVSVHACVGLESKIGNGTFIAPNAYIGPEAEVGDNTIINTGSIIEHEVRIGSHTHMAPNTTVCGRSRIGNNVFCGAGSIIIDNIHICDNVIIGAGAIVRENIIEPGTYVGVPARRIC